MAYDAGALKKDDLARVTVDTTVQPGAVSFPTDAMLLHTAVRELGKLAKKNGMRLHQSYIRVAKRAAMMAGRYAHAKQFKRMNKQFKFLRTRLGRLTRDISGKIDGHEGLGDIFKPALSKARWFSSAVRSRASGAGSCIPGMRRRPSAIGKGKAAKPYEFGT